MLKAHAFTNSLSLWHRIILVTIENARFSKVVFKLFTSIMEQRFFFLLLHACTHSHSYTRSYTQIIIATFLYFLLWLALSVVLSLLVTIYIQLAWACPQLGVSSQANQVGIMDKCFEFGDNPSKMIII